MTKILDAELQTFEKKQKHLEREHKGKFVLIHGDEVIGTYDDFEKAADEGVRQFGRAPFLIRRVGEEPLKLPTAVVYGLTRAGP
ncbi:MAG: hypothetical protein IIA36_00880 [Proteobacteria bacterium]|nr:hypothetical protein [Pseudomonadota bacterium]